MGDLDERFAFVRAPAPPATPAGARPDWDGAQLYTGCAGLQRLRSPTATHRWYPEHQEDTR